MQTFRNNPESEENQRATKQNEREVFALKMEHIRLSELAYYASIGEYKLSDSELMELSRLNE